MNIKKMMGLVMTFLGLSAMPIEDGAISFSEEQKSKLDANFTKATADEMITAFNKELANSEKAETIKAELDKMLKSSNLSEDELKEVTKAKDADAKGDDFKQISAQVALLDKAMKDQSKEIAKQQATITKLENLDLGDVPMKVIKNKDLQGMAKHSATHLFASGKEYDNFDRPWNKAAVGQMSASAIDFDDKLTIEKLNGDADLFYRENPTSLKSLNRDDVALPKHWKRKIKVVDKITSGTIITDEVTQARKFPWLPKNHQVIKPEIGQIYPISVDLEWSGHYLSEQLESWLHSFNNEGSQAYKMSFVRFLLQHIDKQARLEDRIATINGVYVETPENATVPGKFINRQNGILYILWKALKVDKKYKAFDIGKPTDSNIVEYVDKLIKSLPLEIRTQQGLELVLSPYWRNAYNRRMEQITAMHNDYKGYPKFPKDFPNITFTTLVDIEGTDVMYITFKDNHEILENVPKEKSLYTFEKLKRHIFVFSDYKMGIRLVHIGNKVADDSPLAYKVQTVWSNNVPFFKEDFFVPVFDDKTGTVNVMFDHLQVADDFATDITAFENQTPGMVIKIKGNENMPNAKNVVNSADVILADGNDFDLSTGGTLTLFVQADGKLKELSRTDAPEATPIADYEFDGNIIDANKGVVFKFTGNTAITLASIINGVDGKVIKIYGGADAAYTVDNVTDNVVVDSTAELVDDTKFIELVMVDGVWMETSRN